MDRRAYLQGVAALGAAGVAGCLGATDSNPNVELSEPDRQFESADVPYPAWGERIPDLTVPAPLEDRRVNLRAVEKPRLLTFFYSSCPTVCPVLIATLRNVQTHALNHGYGDQVAFLPITFDPARDDAERLRQYAEKMHVDADAGDWHFLRPESVARAKRVVQEGFGVVFQKQSASHSNDESTTTDDGTETADGGTTTIDGEDETRSDGDHHDHGDYMFAHTALTLLVNADGYVERAYKTKSPDSEVLIDDLKTVRNA